MNLLGIIEIQNKQRIQHLKEKEQRRKTEDSRQKKAEQRHRNFIFQEYELFIG